MITEQEGSRVLDWVEEILILRTMEVLKEISPEKFAHLPNDELKTGARNLLGKIGARITFGKESSDGVILRDITVETKRGHSPSNP